MQKLPVIKINNALLQVLAHTMEAAVVDARRTLATVGPAAVALLPIIEQGARKVLPAINTALATMEGHPLACSVVGADLLTGRWRMLRNRTRTQPGAKQ